MPGAFFAYGCSGGDAGIGPSAEHDASSSEDASDSCASDDDCTLKDMVCDRARSICVTPCTRPRGVCPADRHCDEGTKTCVPGCSRDEGCAHNGASEGAGGPRCDIKAHACVACLDDVDCDEGSLCQGSLCVQGCSDAHPCPRGELCCAGKCADPESDPAHCGNCGTACSVANGVPACKDGACSVGACAEGFSDCDLKYANGCEASTSSDSQNCGACGVKCVVAHGLGACGGGKCVVTSCQGSFRNCDDDVSNGCETNIATNMARCGSCTTACDQAGDACSGGQCVPSTCAGTLRDCDGDPNHTCETETRTDSANCGGCGNACRIAHGTGACSSGACRVVSCEGSFADCDGNPSNGCEVDLARDPLHCGNCGRTCGSGRCGASLSASMVTVPASWTFNASAFYDVATGSAVLTSAGQGQGSLIYAAPIVVDAFVASFDFRIGGGLVGDGLGFMLELNGDKVVGNGGGGLGMTGLNGFGVELDTFGNPGCDGRANHVGIDDLTVNGAPDCPTVLAQNESLPFLLSGTGWHTAVVHWEGKTVYVSLDGVAVLSNYTIANFNAGSAYYFGFGGAGTRNGDRHEVRNIQIAFPSPRCL